MGKFKTKRVTAALLAAAVLSTAAGMAVQAAPARVPEGITQHSVELGARYGICPELIQAVCFKESSFNAGAENGGCIGIMQANPDWHRDRMERLGVTDLYDAGGNMLVGIDYLYELLQQYEDISVALMKYNGDSRAEGLMPGTGAYRDIKRSAKGLGRMR